jgi:glutamate dehydrogenase
MATYFGIGSALKLDWLRDRILDLPRADRWQALARAALRDDLYRIHRSLTREVLLSGGLEDDWQRMIEIWEARNKPAIDRALSVLSDVEASSTYDTTTLPVALRELKGLVREDAGQLI